MEQGYWFKTDLFNIVKYEDEATNPNCFGKEAAEWLCGRFKELGYVDAIVIPEDWGWCVMCSSQEVRLWVGCSNVQTEELFTAYDSENPPKGNEVVWHVFPVVETPSFKLKILLKKLLGKIDTQTPLKQLKHDLEVILKRESAIQLCNEP